MTAVRPLRRRLRERPDPAAPSPAPATPATPAAPDGVRGSGGTQRAEPFDRRIRLVVLAAIVLGLALRLWFVLSPLGPFDSDEAVAGLMGRHFLDGRFQAFYWGQPYGGTHEAALVALLLAAGASARLAMELVPIALSAAGALLVWRIGLRTIGRRGALLAGSLAWTTSAVFVWQSTKERSFYATTLVAGLVFTLLTLRLLEKPSRRDAVLLGVAGGIGLHSSPNIVYLAGPAVVWLVAQAVRGRRFEVLRLWWPAALGGLGGASPWLVSNLASGGASFDLASYVTETTYLNRLGLFFKQGLPYALGVQTPHEPIGWFSVLLYFAALAGLVWAFLRLPRAAWGIGIGVLVFPLIFAAFPTSWYVGEPRYLSFLWPLLVLVVAAALAGIRPRRKAQALLAAIAVYTVAGAGVMIFRGGSSVIADYSPGDLGPVVAQLRAEGSTRVFADYWIAYRLALASDEAIVAAPVETARYQPYEVKVRAAALPPYVFFRASCIEGELLRILAERNIEFSRTAMDRFTIVRPTERVLPEDGLVARIKARNLYQGQICPLGANRLP